jgi:hypothetical protein
MLLMQEEFPYIDIDLNASREDRDRALSRAREASAQLEPHQLFTRAQLRESAERMAFAIDVLASAVDAQMSGGVERDGFSWVDATRWQSPADEQPL